MLGFSTKLRWGCAAVIISVGAGGIAMAETKENLIYSFTDPNGKYPRMGPVVDDSTGAIYGVTSQGGGNNYGVIYQILPPTAAHNRWVYTALTGVSASYADPYLTVAGGVLYVSSRDGGSGGCTSCGTIFTLTPPPTSGGFWTETVLYAFGGVTDGASPSRLTLDEQGAIYGTTSSGADCLKYNDCGTAFKLTPPSVQGQPWSFLTLYHFPGSVGGQSTRDGLVLDKKGNLYGSGPIDYASGKFIVYKLTPPSGSGEWIESVLYRFYGSSVCYYGGPLAIDVNGALYGVFSAYGSPSFSSCTDSSNEYVFQLAPSKSDPNTWVKTEMRGFSMNDLPGGYQLTAPLTVDSSGNVYGTTLTGGLGTMPYGPGTTTEYGGTAFVLQPRAGAAGKWNYKLLLDFQYPGVNKPRANSTGSFPNGGLALDSAGLLYGTTQDGGSDDRGAVFRLRP